MFTICLINKESWTEKITSTVCIQGEAYVVFLTNRSPVSDSMALIDENIFFKWPNDVSTFLLSGVYILKFVNYYALDEIKWRAENNRDSFLLFIFRYGSSWPLVFEWWWRACKVGGDPLRSEKNMLLFIIGFYWFACESQFLSFCFRFNSLPSFTEGQCPNSNAVVFNLTNSFASTPIIILNGRSFTIACWIKEIGWVPGQLAVIYSDWYDPWQFYLSTLDRKIIFGRHQHSDSEEWWSLKSTEVILNTWTHVAVTWDHVNRSVFIYVDGKKIGYRSYTPRATFFQPTGMWY